MDTLRIRFIIRSRDKEKHPPEPNSQSPKQVPQPHMQSPKDASEPEAKHTLHVRGGHRVMVAHVPPAMAHPSFRSRLDLNLSAFMVIFSG